MFLHFKGKIVNSDQIASIEIDNLVSEKYIFIRYKDHNSERVNGMDAVNVLTRLCPDALEGKGFKFIRHSWAVHNLVAHPLMQLLSWLHLPSLGIKIHDATVPMPIER